MTLTNQIWMLAEIKRRLNSGNACNHLIQNLLSSRLLPNKIKLRIYGSIILPAVLYECEMWFASSGSNKTEGTTWSFDNGLTCETPITIIWTFSIVTEHTHLVLNQVKTLIQIMTDKTKTNKSSWITCMKQNTYISNTKCSNRPGALKP